MEKSEHGNRSDTDYPFQLLCFLKLHTYTRFQVLIDICGAELIILLENEDLKWSIIY